MENSILILMGPCACGKSQIGEAMANKYNCSFLDADSLHPEENVMKMRSGVPLSDEDRAPWLSRVREEVLRLSKNSKRFTILACSALRKSYRAILKGEGAEDKEEGNSGRPPKFLFVLLDCSRDVLEQRLQQREGHFMKSLMLESQLQTLETPEGEEMQEFIVVNGDAPLTNVVDEIAYKINAIFGIE